MAIELPQKLALGFPPECTNPHPDTVALIDEFCAALKKKARDAEIKYGYSTGWMSTAWRELCVSQLSEHVRKGDPRDVAIYAAFCWFHGWPTNSVHDDMPEGRL